MVSYGSNGELMKVTVICKKKRLAQTPNNYRLDVKLTKINRQVTTCNNSINCFLKHESNGEGLCFPSSTRRTKRGPKCKKL